MFDACRLMFLQIGGLQIYEDDHTKKFLISVEPQPAIA
jgi:hypothetical protein